MAAALQFTPTLIVELPNRAAFLDLYYHHGHLGGVFVPGQMALEPGTAVLLELSFAAERQTICCRGVVRWRRPQQTRDLPAGLGVDLAASEKATRDLLLEFAQGRDLHLLNRRDRRLPVHLEVRYASEGVFLSDVTDDLSAGGLFIASDDPLPIGTPLRLRLKPPGRWFAVEVRGEVAWSRRDERPGFGVRFRFANAKAEQRMRALVAQLRDRLGHGAELRVPLPRRR